MAELITTLGMIVLRCHLLTKNSATIEKISLLPATSDLLAALLAFLNGGSNAFNGLIRDPNPFLLLFLEAIV